MNKKINEYIKNIIIYCVGLFILAMGVAFAIISDLGVSPVSSIPYVVSIITGIDIGACTTAVLVAFIGVQWMLLGKEFTRDKRGDDNISNLRWNLREICTENIRQSR